MRNILASLAAGVIILGGLGWYLGWFQFQSAPTADGHREVKIEVDGKKIAEDVSKGVHQGTQKVEDFLHLQKDGKSPTFTPGSASTGTSSLPPGQSRFRVENGVLIDSGEVSVPLPVGSGTK
jgi:hypothetical protein